MTTMALTITLDADVQSATELATTMGKFFNKAHLCNGTTLPEIPEDLVKAHPRRAAIIDITRDLTDKIRRYNVFIAAVQVNTSKGGR